MDVSVIRMNRLDLITIKGSINSDTAPRFDEALNQSLDRGTANLVIDLSGVDYMSSAGMRALIAAGKRASSEGGRLSLAAPSERVRQVMELAGLLNAFEVFEDQVSAVGSF